MANIAINGVTLDGDSGKLGWTTWVPTFTAGGSMTWTSITYQARYCRIGNVVIFSIYALGTTGGVASSRLNFTLPIAPANAVANSVPNGGCKVENAGALSGFWELSTGSTVSVATYNLSNWVLAANQGIYVSGTYEVA